jgi:hypothetical protein
MKKNITENLLSLGAYSATTLVTKALPQKSITLEELVNEVMPLLSRYAPNITEEIPVFTDWVESNLSAPLKRQKRNSWKWYQPSSRHQVYENRN